MERLLSPLSSDEKEKQPKRVVDEFRGEVEKKKEIELLRRLNGDTLRVPFNPRM
jgi:hypothetical protein